MSFGDFIWVFIIIFSLLPWYRQRMLQANRYRTLRTLEQKRGSRVITLIHRQESISLLGIPLTLYIDIDDSEHILRAIRLTPDDVPIDIILHTPGVSVGGGTDFACPAQPSGQGNGVCAALRHVRWHIVGLVGR